jgi:hypothetical protein
MLIKERDMVCLRKWFIYMIIVEEGSYYDGGDAFASGDLEINNEAYNNPAVMVRHLFVYKNVVYRRS